MSSYLFDWRREGGEGGKGGGGERVISIEFRMSILPKLL